MPIEVKNISHIYMENTPYEKKALNNVSLTINEGEFVAIAGHTGSGKSTLMQHFNGLLNPTRGEVFIDGIDINKKKDKKTLHARRSVGMVFQYPEQQLFEESIFADIAFGPRNFGCSEDEVKQRVKEAMDFVELDYEEYKDKSPFLLSGGQMRRVAIAGIIALKPKYLVLDEPTAGLDPRLKQNLLQKVKKLHQKEKMTIIMVSHNMDDIALLADKVAIMRQGKLMIYGEPREVFTHKDVIEQAGLLEPEVMQLLRKIKEYGLDVDINALNKQEVLPIMDDFLNEMAYDFNTANAVTALYSHIKNINKDLRNASEDVLLLQKDLATFDAMLYVLGLKVDVKPLTEEEKELVNKWNLARKNKDFDTADTLRQEIVNRGIVL